MLKRNKYSLGIIKDKNNKSYSFLYSSLYPSKSPSFSFSSPSFCYSSCSRKLLDLYKRNNGKTQIIPSSFYSQISLLNVEKINNNYNIRNNNYNNNNNNNNYLIRFQPYSTIPDRDNKKDENEKEEEIIDKKKEKELNSKNNKGNNDINNNNNDINNNNNNNKKGENKPIHIEITKLQFEIEKLIDEIFKTELEPLRFNIDQFTDPSLTNKEFDKRFKEEMKKAQEKIKKANEKRKELEKELELNEKALKEELKKEKKKEKGNEQDIIDEINNFEEKKSKKKNILLYPKNSFTPSDFENFKKLIEKIRKLFIKTTKSGKMREEDEHSFDDLWNSLSNSIENCPHFFFRNYTIHKKNILEMSLKKHVSKLRKKNKKKELTNEEKEELMNCELLEKIIKERAKKNEKKREEEEDSKWISTRSKYAMLMAFIAGYFLYRYLDNGIVPIFSKTPTEISFKTFKENILSTGEVKALHIYNRNSVKVELVEDSPLKDEYRISIGSTLQFERKLEEAQKELGIPSNEWLPVYYVERKALDMFIYLLPHLVFLSFLAVMFNMTPKMLAKITSAGGLKKSPASRFDKESAVKVRLKDVAGLDEAKEEVMEFVDFLRKPEKFTKLGAKIPKGAIISGPPGTGKTLLARAVAGEARVPFFNCSGADFKQKYQGVGGAKVRSLFKEARKVAPSIVFIDEIDTIGGKRRTDIRSGGDSSHNEILNSLLVEMDGFREEKEKPVMVFGGTNLFDSLDSALIRPGRFDRKINVDLPVIKGRADIFKVHLRPINTLVNKDQLAMRLAALTPGMSGADIASVCNEAAIIAVRHGAPTVEKSHFEEAVDRVIGGIEYKSHVKNKEELKTTAYHEAGHAVASWYLKNADPLLKVSIVPRGRTQGFAQYIPSENVNYSKEKFQDIVAMALGGRIAEEIFFDRRTTGASDDLRKVTSLCYDQVTKYGMSDKIGHFSFGSNNGRLEYSTKVAEEIDQVVKDLVDDIYTKTTDLLTDKKEEIAKVAEFLLKEEVIRRSDVEKLIGKRPFEDEDNTNKAFVYADLEEHEYEATIKKEEEEKQAKIEKEKKLEAEEEKERLKGTQDEK